MCFRFYVHASKLLWCDMPYNQMCPLLRNNKIVCSLQYVLFAVATSLFGIGNRTTTNETFTNETTDDAVKCGECILIYYVSYTETVLSLIIAKHACVQIFLKENARL